MSRAARAGSTRRGAAALGLVLLLAGCGADPVAVADTRTPASAAPEPAAQRVRVAQVTSAPLAGLSGLAGITEAFRTATVSAEVSGRVVERHVEPGQRVAAGDPLVTLDAALLEISVDEAQATLKAREVDLAEAKRELGRGDELARQDAISQGNYDNLRFARDRAQSARDLAEAALRRAQRARDDAVVRAPFAGTVERVQAQVGDYLAPGAPAAAIADFERVRLRAGVTASEAADLAPGTNATVTVPALGGYETAAAIHSVGLMADPTTGTYPVELWLDNPERRLRGGMVAQLAFAAPEAAETAVVPRSAILRRQGRLAVYVVEERDGSLHAFRRPVRVGRQQGDFVEVLEGARVGERVVVEGLFALTDGATVYVDARAPEPEAGETAWND